MADPSCVGDISKTIHDPLGTLSVCALGLLPEGPLRNLVVVVVGVWIAAIPFVYKYYLGVLGQGAKPEGSIERQDYDNLRKSLKEGNPAARLYARWLTKFLDWIERFFGDAGMGQRTPFLPRFLRLEKPAPLWTAPAFDRCLFLALIYPIATIYLIWAISGHVGPAEAALGLPPNLPGWARGFVAVGFGIFCSIVWRAEPPQSVVWLATLVVVPVSVAIAYAVVVLHTATSVAGIIVGFGVVVAATGGGVIYSGAARFIFAVIFILGFSLGIGVLLPILEPIAASSAFVYANHPFAGTVITVAGDAIFLFFRSSSLVR